VATRLKELEKAYEAAQTEADRRAIRQRIIEAQHRSAAKLAARVVALVRPHAADPASVDPLSWLLAANALTDAANEAADLLLKHHLRDPRVQTLAARLYTFPVPWPEKMLRALADADLPRERKGQALFQLARFVKYRADSLPRLQHAAGAEAQRLERLYGKEYLARLRRLDPAQVEAEAVRLFTLVAEKYADVKYLTRPLGEQARGFLEELRGLRIGKTAPETAAVDLDGVKFRLSDYRGKVVVLTFWAFWCGACREQFPHDRSLVKRFQGRPFALVGVNSDPNRAAAQKDARKEEITWRSFWDGSAEGGADVPVELVDATVALRRTGPPSGA
jgi:thiol-disulfide isomerase/thioredoxin